MKTFPLFITLFITLLTGVFLGHHFESSRIDLPEEWSKITKEDNLKGYVEDGVLHLYFSNPDNSMIDADYYIDLTPDGIIVQTCDNNHIDTIPHDSLDAFIIDDNL